MRTLRDQSASHGGDDTTWVFGIDQELLDVPPPALIEQADAGLIPFFNEKDTTIT